MPPGGMEGVEVPTGALPPPLGASLQDREASGWTQDEEELFMEGVHRFGR